LRNLRSTGCTTFMGLLSDISVFCPTTLDFAGGIVVHTAAGVSALVAAWWSGRATDSRSVSLPAQPDDDDDRGLWGAK